MTIINKPKLLDCKYAILFKSKIYHKLKLKHQYQRNNINNNNNTYSTQHEAIFTAKRSTIIDFIKYFKTIKYHGTYQ